MGVKKLVLRSIILTLLPLVKAQGANNPGFTYTPAFYMAIGAGIALLLLIAMFIYLFIKRPKNRWDKEEKKAKEEAKPQKNIQPPRRPAMQRPILSRKPMRTMPPRRPRPPTRK